MQLLIIHDNKIFARADAPENTTDYSLMAVPDADLPPYPAENAGVGKFWVLDLVDGKPTWTAQARPSTDAERLDMLEESLRQLKNEWIAGESVVIGDKRFYEGVWFVCLQAHTTQAGWEPPAVPALWEVAQ